jgi:thioredoxin reductase
MYDVVVIGGGPAGLNGALILGRCLRKVLVIDSGKPRNRYATEMHGFLSRDGIKPEEFLTIAKAELFKYKIEWIEDFAVNCQQIENNFKIETKQGKTFTAKKLLIATGLVDTLPDIPDIMSYYGKSIHHCPYCDAYEVRGEPIAVFGNNLAAARKAVSLKTWTQNITLITGGKNKLRKPDINLLGKNNIRILDKSIRKLIGAEGILNHIELNDRETISCRAIFFPPQPKQHSDIVYQLNCTVNNKGIVKTDKAHKTNVRGVYVAGDADRDMQQVIIAAAEGARAAMNINLELHSEMNL